MPCSPAARSTATSGRRSGAASSGVEWRPPRVRFAPMKFALAGYGSRGDTEPLAAVGRELLRRGHDVGMAVAPNMLGLTESAGLAAVPFGPEPPRPGDSDFVLDNGIQNPINLMAEVVGHIAQAWAQWGTALTELA